MTNHKKWCIIQVERSQHNKELGYGKKKKSKVNLKVIDTKPIPPKLIKDIYYPNDINRRVKTFTTKDCKVLNEYYVVFNWEKKNESSVEQGVSNQIVMFAPLLTGQDVMELGNFIKFKLNLHVVIPTYIMCMNQK